MKQNEVDLRLIICDFKDITHADITKLTGIDPVYIRIKGEKRNPRNPDSPLWPNNLWSMGGGLDKYAPFEDQMNKILDILEEKITVFQSLASKYYFEFACAVIVYKGNDESTPSVHLDKRYHRIAGLLNIEFDVDIYVKGPS